MLGRYSFGYWGATVPVLFNLMTMVSILAYVSGLSIECGLLCETSLAMASRTVLLVAKPWQLPAGQIFLGKWE